MAEPPFDPKSDWAVAAEGELITNAEALAKLEAEPIDPEVAARPVHHGLQEGRRRALCWIGLLVLLYLLAAVDHTMLRPLQPWWLRLVVTLAVGGGVCFLIYRQSRRLAHPSIDRAVAIDELCRRRADLLQRVRREPPPDVAPGQRALIRALVDAKAVGEVRALLPGLAVATVARVGLGCIGMPFGNPDIWLGASLLWGLCRRWQIRSLVPAICLRRDQELPMVLRA